MNYENLLIEISNREKTLEGKNIRKLYSSDIINNTGYCNTILREDKVKGYRKQQEYGEKKFIKP